MKVTLLRASSNCDEGLTDKNGNPINCEEGRNCPNINFTDRGTLIVQGYVVTDPEALAELNLPPGETAVEIPLALLPELAPKVA